MTQVLSMWTIYEHPRHWPHYVARRFEVEAHGPRPTDDVIEAPDLELIRLSLRLKGLTQLVRMTDDQPHIVETWL